MSRWVNVGERRVKRRSNFIPCELSLSNYCRPMVLLTSYDLFNATMHNMSPNKRKKSVLDDDSETDQRTHKAQRLNEVLKLKYPRKPWSYYLSATTKVEFH
jgi:hypothetical protein